KTTRRSGIGDRNVGVSSCRNGVGSGSPNDGAAVDHHTRLAYRRGRPPAWHLPDSCRNSAIAVPSSRIPDHAFFDKQLTWRIERDAVTPKIADYAALHAELAD